MGGEEEVGEERIVERSHTDRLEAELTLKDQYITGLEGDMKQMKAMHSKENMQYMRHTLVKFLCDSSRSEQGKLVQVVEQLLEMR